MNQQFYQHPFIQNMAHSMVDKAAVGNPILASMTGDKANNASEIIKSCKNAYSALLHNCVFGVFMVVVFVVMALALTVSGSWGTSWKYVAWFLLLGGAILIGYSAFEGVFAPELFVPRCIEQKSMITGAGYGNIHPASISVGGCGSCSGGCPTCASGGCGSCSGGSSVSGGCSSCASGGCPSCAGGSSNGGGNFIKTIASMPFVPAPIKNQALAFDSKIESAKVKVSESVGKLANMQNEVSAFAASLPQIVAALPPDSAVKQSAEHINHALSTMKSNFDQLSQSLQPLNIALQQFS